MQGEGRLLAQNMSSLARLRPCPCARSEARCQAPVLAKVGLPIGIKCGVGLSRPGPAGLCDVLLVSTPLTFNIAGGLATTSQFLEVHVELVTAAHPTTPAVLSLGRIRLGSQNATPSK